MSPTFRLAEPSDAAALSAFARDMFETTFGPANDPGDMDAYMSAAFGPAVQADEITRADTFTILALDDAGSIIGYSYVGLGAPAEVTVGERPIEIKRFYVAHEYHGRGLARAMMEEVFARSRAAGAATVWLGVWVPNARAIGFYQKLGFAQVGTQTFLLGRDLQTDAVMERAL